MTTTKAPIPVSTVSTTVAAAESKIVTVLLWLPRMLWAAILKFFGGITGIKNLLIKYAPELGIALVALIIGAGAIHMLHLHHPELAAPASVKTITVPVVDAKTAAQISLLSSQVENVRQLILKQSGTAQGSPVTPTVAVAPAAASQPQPAAAPVKHKAVPKKTASGTWFQY